MTKETVLVTGGAGYIGSHMAVMLRSAGYRVVVLDNLSRGHRDAVDADAFVEADVRDRAALAALFQAHRVDVVMHFAAFAYVGESMIRPLMYYGNNVAGSHALFEAMIAAGVTRLVFSSTCATYGVPDRVPMDEDEPRRPVNPYGRSKLFVERMIEDAAASDGLSAVSLRYFNAAGADPGGRLGERHDPETHLVPLVLNEALRVRDGGAPADTALEVFGDDYDTADGTCVRDYIHVSDICAAHLLAMEHLLGAPSGDCRAYNLANGRGFSVREVIDACRRVTGIDIEYRVAPRRPGDPPCLVGDASRIERELGWTREIPELDDIVATAWRWMNRGR